MNTPMPSVKTTLALSAATLALLGATRPSHAQAPAADQPAAQPATEPPAEASPAAPAQPTPAPAPTAEPTPTPAPATTPTRAAPTAVEPKPEAAPPAAGAGEAEQQTSSWFARAPLKLTAGTGSRRFALTFYGFIEADFIHDSTRSYNDSIGNSLVAREDTYDGNVGRTMFSTRNTRLGLLFEAPALGSIEPSAVFEGDFFGNQPGSPPRTSEAQYFDSPTFRIRHAYLKLKADEIVVLAGQTYGVFGWQNYFFPCTLEFFGIPNQLFSRSTQFRVADTIEAGPVSIDVAVAAVRPAQRDSEVPDGHGGLRLGVNDVKGITTPGNVGTQALPLSVGVSGVVRQFKVNSFMPPPAQSSNSATGWGISVDALVPVIPAKDSFDRGNRLTLTGSFVEGTGIADLVTSGGGASFPTLPNPALANPPPLYTPDIDNGLVTFDRRGVLYTINWQTFMVGLQYYFPPSGRLIFSANYTLGRSDNIAKLFPQGGAEIELLTHVAKLSRYADANLLWDVTPEVRVGGSFQYTMVEYIDGDKPHNLREMVQAVYVF